MWTQLKHEFKVVLVLSLTRKFGERGIGVEFAINGTENVQNLPGNMGGWECARNVTINSLVPCNKRSVGYRLMYLEAM